MMLRLFFISSLLLLSWTCRAQTDSPGASLSIHPDSLRIAVDGGLQIQIDYGKLLLYPTDFESKWEVGIAWQFRNRFQINAAYGRGDLEPTEALENGNYHSQGTYWRAGINYILPLNAINLFYLGAKYGSSQFEDSGNYVISSRLWPDYEASFKRKNLSATWYEFILGSEKKFKDGHFIAGGQLAIRFMAKRSKFTGVDVYAIPGYGRAFDKTVPAINLYLKYQL